MLKDVELFLCLFILFIAIIVIFNARWIIKNKVKKEVENKLVELTKVIAFIIAVCSFIGIYFIK
jgi:peptidoglycan biosynthesis protein MviN/MurJ (putative lipid II flippase)